MKSRYSDLNQAIPVEEILAVEAAFRQRQEELHASPLWQAYTEAEAMWGLIQHRAYALGEVYTEKFMSYGGWSKLLINSEGQPTAMGVGYLVWSDDSGEYVPTDEPLRVPLNVVAATKAEVQQLAAERKAEEARQAKALAEAEAAAKAETKRARDYRDYLRLKALFDPQSKSQSSSEGQESPPSAGQG